MPRTSTSKKKDVQLTDEALQQERDVMELRRKGLTFKEISEKLNLSGPGQTNKIFYRGMARWTKEIGPEMRDLEQARLDDLQSAIWDKAMAGDLKAVETVLRVMERRARMFGLDHSDKMAAAQLRIEADKVRIMAMALGRALDALGLSEPDKEKAESVMFTEMKKLTVGRTQSA